MGFCYHAFFGNLEVIRLPGKEIGVVADYPFTLVFFAIAFFPVAVLLFIFADGASISEGLREFSVGFDFFVWIDLSFFIIKFLFDSDVELFVVQVFLDPFHVELAIVVFLHYVFYDFWIDFLEHNNLILW